MLLRITTLVLSLGLALNAAAEGCRHGEDGGGWGERRGGSRVGQPGGGRHGSWQIPQEEARRLNPIPVSGESLARGWDVYDTHCMRCHGVGGFGDGPDAAALKVRPAFLRRAAHHHSDGELAWMVRKGRDPMPAWEDTLREEQIWDVINYIRFDIGGRHGQGRGGRGCDQDGKSRGRENCPQQDRKARGSKGENCPQWESRQRGEGCDRRGVRWEENPSTSSEG